MDFKEILKNDVNNVFLNLSEFADTHMINGKEITAVIDDDMLDGEVNVKFHGQQAQQSTGLYNGGIALYISTADFGKPKPGSMIELDGKKYIVISTSEQDGIYKINIQKAGGR